jgi:5-formyltetrahydrofolate cyclo-ligase
MAVPPTSPKAMLRQALKQRRQGFVLDTDIVEAAKAMAELALPHLTDAPIVSAYLAINGEIDPMPLVRQLARRGVTIALPHVTGARDALRFLAWEPDSRLEDGPFGLRQPPAEAREVEPDVILAPLLGFDSALNRIGFGAGHYDRAFAHFPHARRIGLAWSVQACDSIPVDPWDVPLHAVATEQDWIVR